MGAEKVLVSRSVSTGTTILAGTRERVQGLMLFYSPN